MEHTYLRYECADSFGLMVASSSSRAPPSNAILGVVGSTTNASLWITTGSEITVFDLKSGKIRLKVAHRDDSPVGTGRALNADEVVCLLPLGNENQAQQKIATGWVDGTVRIFEVHESDQFVPHSLLMDDEAVPNLIQREPLVLSGHTGSPVRSLANYQKDQLLLASGGSDGKIILWDLVAETGLFRLIGHRNAVTNLCFVTDTLLISCSLDGLCKVWDLRAQCCTQTLASHRGEVWAGACQNLKDPLDEDQNRWRLVTGGSDGRVRVWSVETNKDDNPDEICTFIGTLLPPPNVAVSNEKLSGIHFHRSGRYVGILHANSKHVDVYLIRNKQESQKKRQRRLKRRQEKQKKKSNEEVKAEKGKKRGILDDPESSSSEDEDDDHRLENEQVSPEALKASDEFEFLCSVRCGHKIRGFDFVPRKDKSELLRIVCALTTNALEVHALIRTKKSDEKPSVVIDEKVVVMDFYGHPTGIRSVALSSDDNLACTVSKDVTKIWNVTNRSCIQSLTPTVALPGNKKSKAASACYGLCAAFLPGNTHVAVGTREGHLLLIDVTAGDVVYVEEKAHDGAIWSLDVRRQTAAVDSPVTLVTGSADKSVKFWTLETQDSDNEDSDIAIGQPMFAQTRALQMTDDVISVGYSKTTNVSKRLLFVSTLDCTIKVFFDDSLKMFLSLYGHKLPALAVDCSDDDILLASCGADKTIKIWGLDFGDTHRTLHGHEDSITDVKFVRRTHNFFTASKDGTVRYWDGDRFEQILLLNGHSAEVNSLAVSRTGSFLLSASMDRSVRVWERTRDIVFLEEEREREREKLFDNIKNRDDRGTAEILDGRRADEDDDQMEDRDEVRDGPQSEAAVRKSLLSIASGDRIMEALERADQETKDIAQFVRSHGTEKERAPNMLMMGLSPPDYILWILKTIKSAELEQSILVLPLGHVERLIYYIIILLKGGKGIELCSRVAVFLIKTHQNQLIANRSMAPALLELRRWIRRRVSEIRDVVGFDIAALRIISKAAQERKQKFVTGESETVIGTNNDVWAGMGLGSDLAAAVEGRSKKKKR